MQVKTGFIDCKDSPLSAQPDPYIIEDNGCYYIYCTHGDGVPVYKSCDMHIWEYLGFCLKVDGQKEYWAPCVFKSDNKYYMYYSSQDTSSTDVHEQQIRVAVSDNPAYGFKYLCDLIAPFSIDAHVVQSGGELYMFYSVNDYESERAGTYIVVDKMISPTKMEGRPVAVVVPTLDEEIFQRDRFKEGQHWHTLEGAFYFRVGDMHYLMYSGNCYMNENYYVGYAVASGACDNLRQLKFKKYPNEKTYMPLLRKNKKVEGTGHNSAICIEGKWYVVYHARDVSQPRQEQDTRLARIDDMSVNNGKITVDIK